MGVAYIVKYNGDPDATLIYVRHCRVLTPAITGSFSAISSVFVVDIHAKLQPDPGHSPACSPPHSQPVRDPKRKYCRTTRPTGLVIKRCVNANAMGFRMAIPSLR